MPHATDLLVTLTAALTLAFVGGFAAAKLRFPPIVGYLLAGVALGPFTPGYTADQAIAAQLAEIGVVLLMFGVGIHFSLKDLGAIRGLAVTGALGQSTLATALGVLVALAFGWEFSAGLVLGLSVSVASTVVLLRALNERRLVETFHGRVAVAWLVVEDLLTVAVLVVLPLVAAALVVDGIAQQAPVAELLLALGVTAAKVLGFVALMMLVGARFMPWLLDQVAREGSRELFTLGVLATALGIAMGAALLFEVSLALGAFVAGLVLSESDLSHQATANALPLRDAFAVLFFVSVGMLFNPVLVAQVIPQALAVLGIILVGKPVAAYLITLALGHQPRTGLVVAAGLAQVGEFSFILAELARTLGLLPEQGYHIVLAGAVVSISLNPLVFGLVPWLERRLEPLRLPWQADAPSQANGPQGDQPPRGHAVLAGYGWVGPLVVEALSARGFRMVIVCSDRRLAAALRAKGLWVVYGDPVHASILEHAGVAGARVLVVLEDDPVIARQVIRAARSLNPALDILAVARTREERAALEEAGATTTVSAELELGLEVIRHVLHRFGVDQAQVRLLLQRLRSA